jgi:thiol-disulfide isomerase/thioredoxin
MVPTIMVTTTVPSMVTSSIQTPKTGPGADSSVPDNVTVYFFYGEECPHCHTVMPFIQNLSKKYPQVDFRILETWHNETNNALFTSLNQKLAIQNTGVPEVIVIGNTTPLVGDRAIPAYLEGVILEQVNKKK